METRANYVWVGAVSLALLALMAAAIIWIARLNQGDQKLYDVFFKQSVDGLAKGSEVTFSGVPAGQVKEIELWRKNPEFVRVRIGVNESVPILLGTTATVQGSFTGLSKIQLDGAVQGAPPITEDGPEGVPVIPTKPGGLGQILSNAPLLLERVATLTERLTELLSDRNQESIAGILANTDQITGDVSRATPELSSAIRDLRGTLQQANHSLAAFDRVMGSTNELLNENGRSLTKQLEQTLGSVEASAAELDRTLQAAQPAARQFSTSTLPAAEATLRDLKAASESLREVTERLDERGAAAVIKGRKLPDYKP